MEMEFITVEQLGAFLRRDLTGDLLAEIAVSAACSAVLQATNQQLAAVTDDVIYLDGTGTDALLLPEWPVTGVSEVALMMLDPDADPVVLDPIEYRVNLRRGALYRRNYASSSSSYQSGNRWLEGRGIYKVTYSHGYANPVGSGSGDPTPGSGDIDFPVMPKILGQLATIVAARVFDQGLAKQETIGTYTLVYAASDALAFTPAELNIISNFQSRSRA